MFFSLFCETVAIVRVKIKMIICRAQTRSGCFVISSISVEDSSTRYGTALGVCVFKNLSTTLQFPCYICRNNRTDRDVVRFVCVTNWSEFSLSCLITFILFFLNSVDFINFWIRFLSSIPPILNYKLVEVCHIAFVLANRNAQI